MGYLEHLHRIYGEVVSLPLPRPQIFFFHPDQVQTILKDQVDNFQKSGLYRELIPLLGEGLLTLEGDEWKSRRKLFSVEFQNHKFVNFLPHFTNAVSVIKDNWEASIDKDQPRNLSSDMTQLIFSMSCSFLFGGNVSVDPQLADAFEIGNQLALNRILSPIRLPLAVPLPEHSRLRRAAKTIDDMVAKLCSQRPWDGKGLRPDEIKNNVKTFLFAGHETTSNALSWWWYLMARHPRILEKVRIELNSAPTRKSSNENPFSGLNYTRQTFLEVMRLYPPTPVLSRSQLKETYLGGYDIPAGSLVEVSSWIAHRRQDFWEKPLEFDPDRFEASRFKRQHPFSYFPFGGGPRVCIGENFAIFMALFVISSLACDYEFQLASHEEVLPSQSMTLRPSGGIIGKILRRSASIDRKYHTA